ncbi:hypothetical protein CVT25_013533 [Psilocybe cyanescens]|uniref:Cytochrome P450 n=1 Tax=Psilocybe cyanescens TaxID=93625 RepID=A0A409XSZ3_PSICY|nr:hypothetical protein CVT25_013533 [Psilocybe cyanescens]
MALPLLILTFFGILAIAYRLYQRFSRISLSKIAGPPSESFIIGNLRQYLQSQAGEIDCVWQEQFGDVVKYKGYFGQDHLLISDPKALQFILHTAAYRFVKPPERRAISALLSGMGIVWAEGLVHKRHRKIMMPAFGNKESKDLVPLFFSHACKVVHKWKDIVDLSASQESVLDVSDWIARATLDAMGAAAFDYRFDILENGNNELGKTYTNLCLYAFGQISTRELYKQAMNLVKFPRLLSCFKSSTPNPRQQLLINASVVATKVAKDVITAKYRDNGSLRANESENEKTRMSEDEMVAQMRTMLLAGFETTATSLTWTLLELALHPDVQDKLRREIHQKERDVKARGDTQFSASDFEDMPYLTAVLKESLRIHPAAYAIFREPTKDEIIPLSTPITTRSGNLINEIVVPKGTKITLSINGFNRNKTIFGPDSHMYDPDRWLTPGRIEKTVTVGVYGKSLTFSGGVRSCIGWRFAVLEIQAFLVELIGNFEFSVTPEAKMVRREACLVMTPTIEGHVKKTRYLPLIVKVAKREV